MWERLVGPRDGSPPVAGLWWDTVTPLAADIHIAAKEFHWPVDEYYRRTTWKIRLLTRLALAYAHEQEEEARDVAEQRRETEAAMQRQVQQMQGR